MRNRWRTRKNSIRFLRKLPFYGILATISLVLLVLLLFFQHKIQDIQQPIVLVLIVVAGSLFATIILSGFFISEGVFRTDKVTLTGAAAIFAATFAIMFGAQQLSKESKLSELSARLDAATRQAKTTTEQLQEQRKLVAQERENSKRRINDMENRIASLQKDRKFNSKLNLSVRCPNQKTDFPEATVVVYEYGKDREIDRKVLVDNYEYIDFLGPKGTLYFMKTLTQESLATVSLDVSVPAEPVLKFELGNQPIWPCRGLHPNQTEQLDSGSPATTLAQDLGPVHLR